MNKTSIKNFAIWARNKLIEEITYKAGLYGITDAGIAPELPASTDTIKFYNIGTKEPAKVEGKEIQMRNSLAKVIERKAKDLKYKEAFEYVVEEVAYTWFNRLIAVRFMEVNDYLPSGVRVLSSEISGKNEPDMVSSPFETDIDFTDADREYMANLKDDELFRFLFIKQCNKLNEVLPELFEKTDNYTELLLTLSFTDTDSVVYHLVHDIPEDDFNVEKEGQVQIIGWLYQYYNTEPKDKVFAALKKNVKISKENIPAATQLFTPDWIVRYMVENSLGRLWVDGHQDFDKSEWKYYLEEAEQEDEVKAKLEEIRAEAKNISPEDIKVLDPCMGSGHILVYAFDVLMQIYLSQGYAERDAASLIIKNNLFGADIDKRAYQLSYFALMMKGRAHDRRFLTRDVKPNLCNFQELDGVNADNLNGDLAAFAKQFINADTYGSLLEVEEFGIEKIASDIENFEEDMFTVGYKDILERMLVAYKILAQKYDVVVTNPPYMGSDGMNSILYNYTFKVYNDGSADLFSCFIQRCKTITKSKGYFALITMHSWMFLPTYTEFRKLYNKQITINMLHLGAHAFDEINGEIVKTTTFINYNNTIESYSSTYIDLTKFDGEKNKEKAFHEKEKIYYTKNSLFNKIPEQKNAYWLSNNAVNCFSNINFGEICAVKSGLSTGDNPLFLREWYEINNNYFSVFSNTKKWVPYNKGVATWRWYGMNSLVLHWNEDGNILKATKKAVFRNSSFYFRKGITWTGISSGKGSFRFSPEGYVFDSNKGPMIFTKDDQLFYIMGLLNSKVSIYFINALNQTISLQIGDVQKIPYIGDDANKKIIDSTVENNIQLCRYDWDSFEISWDFIKHPFLVMNDKSKEKSNEILTKISDSFGLWKAFTDIQFNTLKHNEEELNRIFIDIYGLQDELTPEVEDKDVTVRKADLTRDVKSFISYAVGCMFGRYSLDVDGLAYAGGDWDDSKYKSFIPVKDNCIIITDEEFFSDDIVNRFVEFVKTVYGEDTLEENLDFVADALGNKGATSRQKIRNYFLSNFIKDHNKIYQKRPIYWMFDSGKQNGFKALVYMHRWKADTIGNVRVEYLHKLQRVYESEINRMQETIDNSANSKEIANAEKRKDKLSKQQKEAREYDEKISHLALMRTDIDLDDGVKVNYEKVQTAQDGRKLEVLVKI